VPEQEQEGSLNLAQYVQMVRYRKWWLISGLFAGWVIVAGVSRTGGDALAVASCDLVSGVAGRAAETAGLEPRRLGRACHFG